MPDAVSHTMAKSMRTADHLKIIDGRLGRFEANVDERFMQVDKRFEEQRSRFDALHEDARTRFNNLYDLMKTFAEKTDARFDRLESELRTGMADMNVAIQALATDRRERRGRTRIS